MRLFEKKKLFLLKEMKVFGAAFVNWLLFKNRPSYVADKVSPPKNLLKLQFVVGRVL
jgi:hypothetical protein